MSTPSEPRLGAVAACRFALGARPGEIAEAAHDPRGWLSAQLEPAAAPTFPGLAGSAERIVAAHAADRLDAAGAGAALRGTLAKDELAARARHAALTPASFRERWALFWLNHFALQAAGGQTEMLSGAFTREVVDAHALGRFDDLLVAAVRHPAMLIALDQTGSVGPDSAIGRAQRRGVNENLAREVMELHTVGVDGGYGQADVSELALALAGWTVGDPDGAPESRGRFLDDPTARQPGPRLLLGRVYAEAPGRAEAMLRDLARRPRTRARLALKVARYFVADDPPPALTARLAEALERSNGSLDAMARALIAAPEAWAERAAKFKTPYEYLVSAHRAVGYAPDDADALEGRLGAMGHLALWSPTAKGASDAAATWATPLGLAQRGDLAQSLTSKSGFPTPLALAESALGPRLSPRTREALSSGRLERADGMALALMSPEFLHR